MSHSPLIRHTDQVGVFAPQYFGSTLYYASLASYGKAVVDLSMRYDKRFKSVHRCDIVDVRGPLSLTVPVSKPSDCRTQRWEQVNVSSHGQWWDVHRVTLESAYGRTPFFEYYIDRFKPWLCNTNIAITDFDRGLDRALRDALGIDTEVTYTISDDMSIKDHRSNTFDDVTAVEYYQVRGDRLGFIGGLSALDLLFNMGPEAPLVLRDMQLR